MNLEEMEALHEDVDDNIVAELVEEEDASDQKLDEWTDKIMKHLFGAEGTKLKGRKGVRKILSKAITDVDDIENDLGESLDLLDDTLRLLERIHSKHVHSPLRPSVSIAMEEISDWLSNWGLGQEIVEK